jgi:exonuclease V gamma subunit
MDALRAAHEKQLADYQKMIDEAIENRDATKLPDIRATNQALYDRLEVMIQQLALMKNNSSTEVELQKLLALLRKIQQDYTNLVKDTDTLETLRRIRQQEDVSAKRELYWYLIAFVFIAILLIAYLVFYGKSAATAAIASTVPSSPNLT